MLPAMAKAKQAQALADIATRQGNIEQALTRLEATLGAPLAAIEGRANLITSQIDLPGSIGQALAPLAELMTGLQAGIAAIAEDLVSLTGEVGSLGNRLDAIETFLKAVPSAPDHAPDEPSTPSDAGTPEASEAGAGADPSEQAKPKASRKS